MLCTLCQGIQLAQLVAFETDNDDEAGHHQLQNAGKAYPHQPNFEALCISGQNQCELCLLMSEVIEEDQTWNDDDKIYGCMNGESESDLILNLRTDYSAQIYIFRLDGTERQEDAGIFEIAIVPTFIYNLSNSSAPRTNPDAFFWRALEVWTQSGERLGELDGYAYRRLITVDPLSTNAMTISKHWFLECQSSHLECSANVKHAMPTRVIDVGLLDDPRSPHVYESQAETGQWATLSHCWGNTVTTKLTLATYEERMEEIPMAALPKNFLDAIAVTRILGIQYLWIDSLCIIQDSIEDWLQESAKMGEIYKNSLVTIAATNAKESTAGFLRKRQAEVHCDLHHGHVKLPVYIRPRVEWYGFAEIVGPLTRRAWVLQERLLASRILHFGGQQMMWQCRKSTLAEGFCDTDSALEEQIPGKIESMLRSGFHANTQYTFDAESNFSVKAEALVSTLSRSSAAPGKIYSMQDNIYGQWYHLIGIYARLNLTKHTDKFPAIAGIARQVQLRTDDTYLAGLWKSDIQRGLQWWCSPPATMEKPPVPRAPSWSWAALDLARDESGVQGPDPVIFSATIASRHCPYEHGAKLVGFSHNLIANGCLGSAFGSINLQGLWTDATVAAPATAPPGRFNLSYPTPLTLKAQSGTHAAARLDSAANTHTERFETMGCLQVGKFLYTGPKHPAEVFISALLLQYVRPITEGVPAQYVRIGLVVLFSTCDPKNGWEERVVEVV
ncbi:hypothetical protein MMC22_006080 [Lobaria immixta]|nr:hypothetical protein [Lobaria immixta]